METRLTLRALTIALGCAALWFGCDGDDAGGSPGPIMRWMPADSGIPPRPDGGQAASDAQAGSRACVTLPALGEAALPRCSVETRDCVAGCPAGDTGSACRDACWGSDTTPAYDSGAGAVECADCIFRKLLECLQVSGCEPEVDAYLCCIVDHCAGADNTCISSMCAESGAAMFTCGGYTAPECFQLTDGYIGQCYAGGEP